MTTNSPEDELDYDLLKKLHTIQYPAITPRRDYLDRLESEGLIMRMYHLIQSERQQADTLARLDGKIFELKKMVKAGYIPDNVAALRMSFLEIERQQAIEAQLTTTNKNKDGGEHE